MCVAIPQGRRSNGPQGTRLGRFLRERPWRITVAVPLGLAPLLGTLWAHRDLDPGAPLTLILLVQAPFAAPVFGLIMTGLPTVARTSPPGHLWFAALSVLFLVGSAGCAIGGSQGPGWAVPGLVGLAWAWWLTAAAPRWHLGWSRVLVAGPVALLPVAAYGGALGLGLTALAAALSPGPGGALPAPTLTGLALTALIALIAAFALGTPALPGPNRPVPGHA